MAWLRALQGESGFKLENVDFDKISYFIHEEPLLELIEKRLLCVAVHELLDETLTVPKESATRVAQKFLDNGPGDFEIIHVRYCQNCGEYAEVDKCGETVQCSQYEEKHSFQSICGQVICVWCGCNWRVSSQCRKRNGVHNWSKTSFRVVRCKSDPTASFSANPLIHDDIVLKNYSSGKQDNLLDVNCVLCGTPYNAS